MSSKIKQQRKKSKPDPITNWKDYCNAEAEAVYHALRPLDQVARAMEKKWGVDRLPALVSPETAAKFGSAKGKLDAAIQSGTIDEVTHKTKVMMRAWNALDKEAEATGAEALEPEVWTVKVNQQRYAFVQSNAEAWKASPKLKGVRVMSLDEVARLLDTQFEAVGQVKDAFPGATVKDAGKRQPLDDEIPF